MNQWIVETKRKKAKRKKKKEADEPINESQIGSMDDEHEDFSWLPSINSLEESESKAEGEIGLESDPEEDPEELEPFEIKRPITW